MINANLEKYKDRHSGESILYFGSGKSLSLYDNNKSILKVGAGGILFWEKEVMDYYFITDSGRPGTHAHLGCVFGYYDKQKEHDEYKPGIEKIYRLSRAGLSGMPSGKDATYYNITKRVNDVRGLPFFKDITLGLGYGYTSSVEIIQFLCYMGFKNIYLIGHDCDYSNGSFLNERPPMGASKLIEVWRKIKLWVERDYPDTNIFSINPINLKIFPEKGYADLKGETVYG